MRFSSRLFLYAPLLLFVLLLCLVSAYWWQQSQSWKAKLDALNGKEVMPGITMQFAERRIGGFPFRVDTILKQFELKSSNGFSWKTEDFAIHRLSYKGGQYIFEAAGQQQLRYPALNGENRNFVFLPGSLRADALLQGGILKRFDLVLVALSAPGLTAEGAELHLRHLADQNKIEVVAFANKVSGMNGDLRLVGDITSAMAFMPLLHGTGRLADVLDAWRKDGSVTLHKFQSGNQTATGRLKLDAQNRLTGQLSQPVLKAQTLLTPPLY